VYLILLAGWIDCSSGLKYARMQTFSLALDKGDIKISEGDYLIMQDVTDKKRLDIYYFTHMLICAIALLT
jgi:hypothetical protein